jgi:tetratricopeptide (TPR) repeat protein
MRLGRLRFIHYKTTNSYQQLDQSIHHLTEALVLPPKDDPDPDIALHILILAGSLYLRWSRSKQPDDIKSCIKYFRYLRGQQIQAHQRNYATSSLVLALANSEPVESMSDIVVENIKEMTILCRELLNSVSSASPLISPFQALTTVISCGCGITGELQDHAIECLREAKTCFPSSPRLSFMLGYCLAQRFGRGSSIVDYEEAMPILDKVTSSSSDLPEDVRSDIQQKSLGAIACLSYTRYYSSGKPEHLEEAISHIRTYLSSIPLDHEDRPRSSQKLTDLIEFRVRGYTTQLGSQKCPDTFDFSTLSSLTTTLTEPNSSTMSHDQWGRHHQALSAITLTAQTSIRKNLTC